MDSFTFDAPDAPEINGNPWGVWFGTNEIVDDPPTPTGNDYWSMVGSYANDWKSLTYSRLYFIPPVRRFSFTHATGLNQGVGKSGDEPPPDAFGYYVLDTAFHYVIQDSIRANGNTFTTRIDVSTGDEDRIHHVLFKGYMNIDDLVVARGAEPVLVCSSPVRADDNNKAVCTVDAGLVDSVYAWRFEGPIFGGSFTVDTIMSDAQWVGRAALTGLVSVEAYVQDSLTTYSDSLIVQRRNLGSPAWKWDDTKWDYQIGQGKACHPKYAPYYFPSVFVDSIPAAENSSTEDCAIRTFTPQSNDIAVFPATYAADSIFDGGPNHGLFLVSEAYYAMKHGSYYNPSVRPDTAGSLVTASSNLKACKAPKNVSSITKNLHEYNLMCTKGQAPNIFSDWWAAVERHEGYGTPGMGPNNNGHQILRELSAQQPGNDPYEIAERTVASSSGDLLNILAISVGAADQRIHDDADYNHNTVTGNWGSYSQSSGQYCGEIYVYFDTRTPAEYDKETICGT